MTAVVALVDAGHDFDPRLNVTVQSPLLLVDERLHVDRRQLVWVILERHLADGPLTHHRQRDVLYSAVSDGNKLLHLQCNLTL